MKKINLNIILFLATLFFLGSFNLLEIGKSNTSELENRVQHQKPVLTAKSLFSGEFFKEYEEYYSDNFILRDKLIKIGNSIKEFRGLASGDGASIVQHKGANLAETGEEELTDPKDTVKNSMQEVNKDKNGANRGEGSGKIQSKSANGENNSSKISIKETSQSEKEDARKIGSMLILKDRAMEIYSFSNNESSFYAGIINSFEEKLGGRVKVYSLLAPTQVEFIENENYKTISTSQKKVIEYVNQQFSKNIIPVNAYDALSSNRDKYIYFKTDHHWTALGAYYAYTAFADAIGEEPVPIEKYEVCRIEGFLGSTYSATLNKKLQGNPDTIYYYKPFIKHEYRVYYEGSLKMNLLDINHANKKNKYRIFLSGDRPLGKITTEVQNGKKILIIKDSYGNAFVPFLLPHYNEIYIVDPRQFKKNILEFIKENGIQEVLFLDYVPAANMKNFSQLILDMMNR